MASDRFGGTERLYGIDDTAWLGRQHVLVVGVGGVGSWAAEALVRTAVGRITLIDLDDVCVSNTNRQSHTMNSTLGQMKVDVLSQRLSDINPECTVEARYDFLTPDNLDEHLDPFPSAVLDAIDSVKVKAALINHCRRRKIPLVTTGGAGGQTDPLKINVTDLARTEQDPLASRTRQLLRRDYGFSRNPKKKFGVDCVYSTEQLRYPQANGEVCATKPADNHSPRLDCATGFGASVMVTASFGMVAASRVIDKLLAARRRLNSGTEQAV